MKMENLFTTHNQKVTDQLALAQREMWEMLPDLEIGWSNSMVFS
jgi:hypothetical protein